MLDFQQGPLLNQFVKIGNARFSARSASESIYEEPAQFHRSRSTQNLDLGNVPSSVDIATSAR
jgi:hypothetical protein